MATFFVVTLIIRGKAQPAGQASDSLLISYAAIVATFAAFVVWVFVPRVVAGKMRRAIIDGRPPIVGNLVGLQPAMEELRQIQPFATLHQTKLIIACAILEGAAFFNVMAYFLEGQPMNLVAAGVLALLLLSHFPTTSRLESWIEDDLATTDQFRSLRRT